MTLSTGDGIDVKPQQTFHTFKESDVLPDFLPQTDEKLCENETNIEPIRIRTSSLLHNSHDNIYGSGTYDLPQISKCDITCSIERSNSSDHLTYSNIPFSTRSTNSQSTHETYSMNSTIPLRTQKIHNCQARGHHRLTERGQHEGGQNRGVKKSSTFCVVCCPTSSESRMPSKVNLCLMAVILVLACFVSMLSVMVVTGQNFTSTSEQPFDVTTTETQNVTEAEPTSMGSHKINCSAKWNGYCMNGGRCTFLLEQATAACECPALYGGRRCEKFLWYTSKSDCEDEKAIDTLMLALFIITIIFLLVIIIVMGIQLRRFFLKIKKLERKNEHSQFHDYGSHFLPAMYSTQISAISHEKHDMKSRSAPVGLGRLSQNFLNPSPTESNGVSERTKSDGSKQENQHKNGKTSQGSDSSA